MNALFSQLARQSMAAGWMILALLLLRPLLKKVPKSISCLLWALAAVRLAVPISVKSPVSLVPEQLANPVRVLPAAAVQIVPITQEAARTVQAPAFSLEALVPWLWLAGAAAMALYALYSYIRLVNRVQVSIRLGDRLYISDNVASPFILGVFRPKIYLPSEMDQTQADLVLAHERAHLRRGDHLWKPLGYGLLCLHWFNPLCWAAYLLFCRDMEQACDESVVRNMSAQDKKAYSAALVRCSIPRSAISACPLAFGEVGVKQRIQGILNYRKPKFWVLVISALLCAVLAACFLTDPVKAGGTGKSLYLSPSRNAQVIYELSDDEDYTVRFLESIDEQIWAYVQGDDAGWMPMEAEEADRLGLPIHTMNTENPFGELLAFPQETVVCSAPDRGARVLARYPAGMPITVYSREFSGEDIWGLLMGSDGEVLGWIVLDGTEQPLSTNTTILESTAPRTDEEQGAFMEDTLLYAAPSLKSREVTLAKAGEQYTVIRKEPIGTDLWGYLECREGTVNAWMLLDETEEPLSIAPSTGEKQGTFTEDTLLYAAPSLKSREATLAKAGEHYTVIRKEPIGSNLWGYLECREGTVYGWMLMEGEDSTAPLSYSVPVYAEPSEEAERLGQLSAGQDYTIQERKAVGSCIWGYAQTRDGLISGWILLGRAQDGTTLVNGTVMGPENLNVRSGPGLSYSIQGYLAPGTQVIILEQVEADGWLWGCIGENSWVCMNYLECYEKHSDDQLVQYAAPEEQPEERYTFAQETVISRTPTQEGQEAARAKAGESCTVLRREFVNGESWGYVRLSEGALGWLHFQEEDEALNYFREYIEASAQPTPEEAEQYLYFASEYAREFYRDYYEPVTGWYPSGMFRVNDNLWGIVYSDPESERSVYSFVGRMEDRLYVFRTVHEVPAQLSENLEVSAYEEENAMYLSEGYLENVWVQKRLLEFAVPQKVEIQEDGTRDYAGRGCAYEDMICGTDMWRVAESQPDGQAHCTITLTARDGSTARFWDVDGSVLVTRPEGKQEIYRFYATGEETITMLYDWAKARVQ